MAVEKVFPCSRRESAGLHLNPIKNGFLLVNLASLGKLCKVSDATDFPGLETLPHVSSNN